MNEASNPATQGRHVAITVTALTRVTTLGITSITYLLISRILGPAGFGTFTVLVTIATVATQVGHLSLQLSQTYLWINPSLRRSLAANSEVISFLAGSLGGAAAWALVYVLGHRIVPVPGLWILAAAASTVPFTVVVMNLGNIVILDDHIKRVNAAYALGAVCQVGAVIVLALLGHLTVASAVWTWVASEVVPALVLVHALPVSLRDISVPLAKRTVALGLRYHVGVAFLFLLLRADILILNAIVQASQVGRYALAVAIAEVTYLSADAVAQVMLPRQTDATMEASAQLTVRLVRLNAVVGALSAAAIVLATIVVVPVVFGHKYAGVLLPLAVLMPGVIALATIRASNGYLVRLNQPFVFAATAIGAMVLNVGLNFALIPGLGIVGSALASSVAYSALAVCYVAWISAAAHIRLREFVPRRGDFMSVGVRRRGGGRPGRKSEHIGP